MFLSKYGVARTIRIPVVKRAVVDFAVGADWTPAAGDVKISKDGGAFANVTNLPTVLASANTGAVWLFALTATEMQAADVVVVVSDAATKAVEDQAFIIETYGNASGQHEMDFDTPTIVASSVSALAANVITAASIATDAGDEIADKVWDEALSGHVAAGSAGAEQQFGNVGTATAGAASTITLEAGASATDDIYNGRVIRVIDGAGRTQEREITDYVGSTKVATVSPAWRTPVGNTSSYVIL